MRSSRLMALLMLCRERERWTAAQLADRLEVSERTVYRDVAALQAAGVPLWTSSGPGGGVHLLPGWRTDLVALTGEEADALALAGLPGAVSDLGWGAVALSARLKVRHALPPELRARSARISERFHLDAPGWFHHDEPLEHLGIVAEAVWSGRRLDVDYRSGDGRVQRRLGPLGLVLKAGTWYLVASHRREPRTYRIGRIEGARLRHEPVERPAGFDLATWWAASSEEFDRSLLRVQCTLRLSPSACARLGRVVGATAATEAMAAADAPDAEGWQRVELRGESEEVLAGQLLALTDHVEVLAPPGLRTRLALTGTAIAERNR